MIITIPSTTQDIGIHTHYAAQKKKNTQALFQIFSSIKFLSWQGLPLRGDGTEADGNLQQLLKMKAKEDHNLADWLRRTMSTLVLKNKMKSLSTWELRFYGTWLQSFVLLLS